MRVKTGVTPDLSEFYPWNVGSKALLDGETCHLGSDCGLPNSRSVRGPSDKSKPNTLLP